jgi:hypothetical protein
MYSELRRESYLIAANESLDGSQVVDEYRSWNRLALR